MPQSHLVKHHMHKRKLVHKNLEKYPHKDPFKRTIDTVIYFVGVLGPVAILPQIIKIFVEKSAASVSFVYWFANMLFAVIWVAYGFLHKEKPIIVAYMLWFTLDLMVVIGVLKYGGSFL